MPEKIASVFAKGNYYWESFFSYDNRGNKNSTITREVKIEKEKRITSKVFLSKNTKITSRFSYKNEASATIGFKAVKVGADAEYSFHIDAAIDLVSSSERNEDIFVKESREERFEIAPGDSLIAYQLCYIMDGVKMITDTTAVTSVGMKPPENIFVELEFDVTSRLLGYKEISSVLLGTNPGSSNKVEWQQIREAIISLSSKDQFSAFYGLVKILSGIHPGIHNKLEWEYIRKTSREILDEVDSVDAQILLSKLLTRFSTTYPGTHNKKEWERIRSVSNDVLNNVKSIY